MEEHSEFVLGVVLTLRGHGSSELGYLVVIWRCLGLQRALVWEGR